MLLLLLLFTFIEIHCSFQGNNDRDSYKSIFKDGREKMKEGQRQLRRAREKREKRDEMKLDEMGGGQRHEEREGIIF